MSTDPFDIAVLLVIVFGTLGMAAFAGHHQERADKADEFRRAGRRA